MGKVQRDIDPLVSQVARLSRLLHRLKALSPVGSQDRSANVLLLVIDRLGPLRLADLASTCHVDSSTVSRQAADLVREGLLRREADPADGRASLMALTPAGAEVVADLARRRGEFFTCVVSDWESDEVATFLAQLTRFIDGMETRITALTDRPQIPNADSKVDA